jgi:hypothetical protein
MSQLGEISHRFKELHATYNRYLPKVDPALINDLLLRQIENPSVTPQFMIEVFIKPRTNREHVRAVIMKKTGMNPAMYDNGTHCVITQKLTMDKLKEISELDEALEITGKYIGGLEGYKTFPEQRHEEESGGNHGSSSTLLASSTSPSIAKQSLQSMTVLQGRKDNKIGIEDPSMRQSKQKKRSSRYRIAIYTVIGIVATVALAGFIISGGMLPNVNQNGSTPPTIQTESTTGTNLVPGALHGYVKGPTGLPAIGASVVAANQDAGYTENAVISINGQYLLSNLPAGEYIVMVAYPDGTNDVVNGFKVESGSNHQLDFSY